MNSYNLIVDGNELLAGKRFLNKVFNYYNENYLNKLNEHNKAISLFNNGNQNNKAFDKYLDYSDSEVELSLHKASRALSITDVQEIKNILYELKRNELWREFKRNEIERYEEALDSIKRRNKSIYCPSIPEILEKKIEEKGLDRIIKNVFIHNIGRTHSLHGDYLLTEHSSNRPVAIIELKRTFIDFLNSLGVCFLNILGQKRHNETVDGNPLYHLFIARAEPRELWINQYFKKAGIEYSIYSKLKRILKNAVYMKEIPIEEVYYGAPRLSEEMSFHNLELQLSLIADEILSYFGKRIEGEIDR